MNSVSSQIQRAINDAINNQVLPQIQNVIMAGSGQETRMRWERSDERPESYPEVQYNVKTKNTLNSEHEDTSHRNVHDNSNVRPTPQYKTKFSFTIGKTVSSEIMNCVDNQNRLEP